MDFVLSIFPQGALAGSVVTTVWVGVLVIVFFNLRFGWVLSGLVVPGYLVPLLMIRPWSAAVIGIEAVVTFLLVWLYSEQLSRFKLWNNFFGRDRFFALLVVSVIVRVSFETLLFPVLGRFLDQSLDISFQYHNVLHSYGLVIVALIANQFWKPGLIRGVIPLGVCVGVTYALVRYVLVPYTNFSLGNIGYMYEDLAVSMLASPKAYILLLATALAASRMNLLYAWEYSGILIPALLALQWYQPMKLAASFAEAFVILGAATLILRLPLFQNATVEGGRKLLLFFNISFGYKLLLGYCILWFFPQYKITDYYAFGYLLSTLLAMKMFDKDMLGQVTRATLQTSLVSAIMASMIGFSLQLLPNVLASQPQSQTEDQTTWHEVDRVEKSSIQELIHKDKPAMYAAGGQNQMQSPSAQQIEAFTYSLRQIKTYLQTKQDNALHRANSLLQDVGYQLQLVQGRYLDIHAQKDTASNWGRFVINLQAQSPLLVQIPAPQEAWGTVDAGTRMFTAFKARALAIAGPQQGTVGRETDVFTGQGSLFFAFYQVMGGSGTLQVRGYTPARIRRLTGRRVESSQAASDLSSRMYIHSQIPAGLDLSRIKSFLQPFDLIWGRSKETNIIRRRSQSGFAELILSRADRRNLFFKPLFSSSRQMVHAEQNIAGYIQDWLLQGKKWLAPSGSNAYQPPSLEQLLYMDQEVLVPLLHVAQTEYRPDKGWTQAGQEELGAVRSAASVLGYEIIRYRHAGSGRDYLILIEGQQEPRRYWGTYVLLLGAGQEYMVQIPRPLYEMRTFEFGVHLFARLQAKFLMIAGTHPTANTDQSSDLILGANNQNMFNLFEQVVLREKGPSPMYVAQCRGFGLRPESAFPDADVVLSFQAGVHTRQGLGALGHNLVQTLQSEGLSTTFVDGSLSMAGYEVGGLPQAKYLEQTVNKRFALLWLSPLARKSYRQQMENRVQNDQFNALNIPTQQVDVARFLVHEATGPKTQAPEEISDLVARYRQSRDVVQLSRLEQALDAYQLKRLVDMDSKQAYLYVARPDGVPVCLANLAPRTQKVLALDQSSMSPSQAREFVAHGGSWVFWGEKP